MDNSPTSRATMPPFVYVPTSDEPDPAERHIVLHLVQDGRTALYTYSAIDRLHRFYRPDANWVVCDVATLQRVFDSTPYEVLFVDVDPRLSERSPADD